MTLISPFIDQPIAWLAVTLALSAAFLLGFARSGLGTGGFVVSPLMVFALGASDGLAIVAVLMLPAALLGVWQHRGEAGPELLRPLIPAAFLGTALGGLLLWLMVADGEMALIHRRLELVVAGLSLVYVAMVAARNKIASIGGGGGPPHARGLFLVGTGLGISQTVANSGSPLLTLYFLRHGIPKAHFVAAQLDFLLVQNLLKLAPLLLLGILHLGNAGAALALIPVTLLGSLIGRRFYRTASERIFFALYLGLLLIGFVVSLLLIIGRDQVLSWI
ncbi:hypothetical protein CKO25_04140 [Thiocapsa imhoffii]|uniref:Probable membrane transporter protein n=1 Tax=Thiocapsa imhoffii TaxID=382777 RepID=A0A9X1B7H7_9GAMM|nr:TSUP family transporter [Thiocapsa imhoffii]MBK1643864.1 hypothetical protein [Thiocapsa imhoffii]